MLEILSLTIAKRITEVSLSLWVKRRIGVYLIQIRFPLTWFLFKANFNALWPVARSLSPFDLWWWLGWSRNVKNHHLRIVQIILFWEVSRSSNLSLVLFRMAFESWVLVNKQICWLCDRSEIVLYTVCSITICLHGFDVSAVLRNVSIRSPLWWSVGVYIKGTWHAYHMTVPTSRRVIFLMA